MKPEDRKFVQIVVGSEVMFALDEEGDVWEGSQTNSGIAWWLVESTRYTRETQFQISDEGRKRLAEKRARDDSA